MRLWMGILFNFSISLVLTFTRNLNEKGKKLMDFTKEGSTARVLLLNIAENASGLNITEANYIILMGM